MKLTHTPKTVLHAQGVNKSYGVKGNMQKVLKDVNLRVTQGEFLGIMGPSGSGKTTLLNTLATIDRASEGKIMINENDVSRMKDKDLSKVRRANLGFIFQDYNLLDTLTVKENILLPISLMKMTKKDAEKEFQDIADSLKIKELANNYPSEISGGQKQRTSAARALIHKPSIVFADEPTGALDSKAATSLLENLNGINEKRQVTIVMVTHDPVAASYCSRVVFLKDGKIFSELYRGVKTREVFFKDIMDVQVVLGGDHE
ncbi:ABC transporter ATP-binding protein [Salipaludibacillus agaradhaerens]|jgi:bacitracin transport system ATP-binding protein|uniref:ABC transporter ATP-binding protein n=1 Tax=Salipaludibacillus agaradhaerens TaxID=76935 RepID=UPI0021517767|nr:ABC transporter ATP-binding protein [Salipaludibacillus agaradhaerens]MCR6106139.1 ABC transporter ATP-binding protein [Salipaludibacillus agaradhaerens]MCR6118172.1 ABC transporter ATP-binding protein [Salipaludibacillus agaradhaerens]